MKRLWYYGVRAYVSFGLWFYYKRIVVKNPSNIPVDEAVIFAANHQNAFLDAIVVACTNDRYNHFLVRADIFKKAWAIRLLNSLNMMPAYRIRDGWQSLGKNQETFEQCEKILADKNPIVIFPEGNHGGQRRLRTLSKGFTRVAFKSIRKNSASTAAIPSNSDGHQDKQEPAHLKVYIVPVGLNYTDPQGFRGSVSVYYGEPILANDYFSSNDAASATRLKDEVALRLKKLITHVEDEGKYESIIRALDDSDPDYLDPIETNRRIELLGKGTPLSVKTNQRTEPVFILKALSFFSSLVNVIPLALWGSVRNGIKDPVFVGSMKFVFGIFVFPLYYLVVALLFYFLAGPWMALGVLVLLMFSMIFYK